MSTGYVLMNSQFNGVVMPDTFIVGKVVGGASAVGITPTTQTLDDLSDVMAPSPSSGEVLGWNGSAWVNTSTTAIDNDARFLGLIGF